MKILFVSHYFPPEVNAPANRTYDHAVRWVQAGHDVTVLTCVPNHPRGVAYDGYANRFRSQEQDVNGVRVVRVWTYLAANAGTVRRIANYLSFLFSAVFASFRISKPDLVVATSPQFFCGWAGVMIARLKRVPFVLEIRDIWPESIAAVGAMRQGPLIRFLEALERRMYLAADRIVAVGEGYRDNICGKVPSATDKTVVIPNGVDLSAFRPRPLDPSFRAQWNLRGKFVCSYIGTIGMAHGLDVVLEAAQTLKRIGRDDIRFCLIGDGAERATLERRASELQAHDYVVFTGRLSRQQVQVALASSDACLVHLRDNDLFSTVIPSKIFEMMAMQRPIIMGVRGEALDLVMKAGVAMEMEPGSPTSLVAAIEELADNPELIATLRRSGRDFVTRHYSRDVLAATYLELLQDVAKTTCNKGGRSFPSRDTRHADCA